jgi:hypothetical protein
MTRGRVARSPGLARVRVTMRVATLVAPFAAGNAARAQDLEPRAYAANPVGVGFVGAALGYSKGGVVLDPTAPISDVRASAYSAAAVGGLTFAFFGRTASVVAGLPYAWLSVQGNVGEEARTAKRAGLADARVRLSVNLLGGQALSLGEFARRTPSTVVGTSISISVPTGQYFPDKLINVGTNRWAFKPEIGVSVPAGRWTLELYGGGWFFTRNASYFDGHTKAQRSLLAVQSHVAYTARPRLWIAANATFYSGGRAEIDGVPAATRQENTRVGLTASFPVLRTSSVKVAWSTGAVTRLGGNFNTVSLGWQTTIIRRPPRPGAASE